MSPEEMDDFTVRAEDARAEEVPPQDSVQRYVREALRRIGGRR